MEDLKYVSSTEVHIRTMENNAAVLYGPKDLRIEKWLMPEISENEVLIKIECVGVCGTDVNLYYKGKCGLEVLSKPIVLGHEGAGVVVEVGSNVTNVAVGDRVAVEPTQPCRSCELCKQGRYNLCTKPRYCSTTDAMGNLCNYYKHVADFCHKIPDNVTMEEAAAVQPLAIAIHACSRANIRLGSIVVILGAGPIGVLCAMTAKAMGASKILITDIVESRLHMAKQQGADYTLLVTPDSKQEDIVDKITKILGASPNVTIDACGSESAQGVAMMVTRSGGTVLVVGIGEPFSRVPITNALLREVDIRGAYRLLNSYPLALAAVSSGSINLKSFITHHFPLQKSKEAVEFAATGEAMKIIIHL